MSDDGVLRRAAELVRDHGLHALPGPWVASNPRGARQWEVAQAGHEPLAQVPPHDGNRREPANAEWIALMNPDIAEALAALLDAATDGSLDGAAKGHALNVANALVRDRS